MENLYINFFVNSLHNADEKQTKAVERKWSVTNSMPDFLYLGIYKIL